MFNPNNLHPLPRYGLAAAIYTVSEGKKENFPDITQEGELIQMALTLLKKGRQDFLLKPSHESVDESKVNYTTDYVDDGDHAPGSKYNRNSANGYFLAPHILTGNNSGPLVKELYSLHKLVGTGKIDKLYGMKRSFSPLTSKINAGTRSMSDPPDDLLSAAFTAIAVTTPYKAAALDYDSYTNAGLVPDLDFYDSETDSYPLINYIKVLARILEPDSSDKLKAKYDAKTKKYSRPSIYHGNYQYAPRSIHVGSISLLVALSGWLQQSDNSIEAETVTRDEVVNMLRLLEGRPVYTFGYDANRQETVKSHLVELAREQILFDAASDMFKIRFYDSPDKLDYSGTKWKMFVRYFDNFLRFFTETSLRNLLSLRMTYPDSFSPIFYKYFTMSKDGIKPEIVDAAIALGRSLNRAAYTSAKEKEGKDKVTDRNVREYKARVLASLESSIRSARTPESLLAQISTLTSRMTNYDLDNNAAPLMRAMVVEGDDHLALPKAKDLIIAFMRLNHFTPKINEDEVEVADQSSF